MATVRCRVASIALSVCSSFFSSVALGTAGQPGTLDPFWATGSLLGAGKVITPIGSAMENASAVVLQPDGKVVVSGYCSNGTNNDICALRYNANGTLDATFGSGGAVITPVGSGSDTAAALALQPDGKLVLAGACFNGTNSAFCALRYNANGTLDVSFGSGGKVVTSLGTSNDTGNAIALQPDGKLVLAGTCVIIANADFCVLRYNANGTLDTGFGSGGTVTTAVGTGNDSARALALQPDGKLLVAGTCFNVSANNFCTARYSAIGTLDPSFGSGGKVITPVGVSDQANALALQPDGKVVLAGVCFNGTRNVFCALRYNANGTLDTTFGSGGTVLTPVGASDDYAYTLALQPDGKLVLAGRCSNGTNSDICALRYNGNGTLDATFGSSGKVVTPVGTGDDIAYASALQPDGKLLLAGTCANGSVTNFCTVRYDGGPFGFQNCKPDLDGDGLMTATVDGLIYMRVMLGMTGNAVVSGISFPPTATRNTWPLIRDYLVTQCGMSLVQ